MTTTCHTCGCTVSQGESEIVDRNGALRVNKDQFLSPPPTFAW